MHNSTQNYPMTDELYTPLLDTIESPRDLRSLPESSLESLAREIRDFLLQIQMKTRTE